MMTENIIAFSEEDMVEVRRMIAKYPEGRQKSALLPLLHFAQEKFNGWLSVPAMDYVASLLNIKPIEVYEVASFYTMYNLKPVGKVVLEFCRTSPCCISGAEQIIGYTERKLGIKNGETTADGMFTIKCTECLGACGYAPMMQVGERYHEFLTEEKIDELLNQFRQNNI
jgi:NADH-quinone oxidoreductase subunit E